LAPEGYLNPNIFNTVGTVQMDLTKGQLFRNINANATNGGWESSGPSGSKLKTDEYPLRERRAEVNVLQ